MHQQSDILSKLDDRDKRALTLHKSADGVIRADYDQIWIPTRELKLRICIIGHSASSGHRGIESTTKTIKSRFYWMNMDKDIRNFCMKCLH